MPNDWNPAKCAINIAKHGLDFTVAEDFEWATAHVRADTRHPYGEVRLRAVGVIGERLYSLVFTIRRNATWIISLRRASRKEIRDYEAEN